LMILEALLKWEDKLMGQEINIVTDHRTLEFFKSQKDMAYHQWRWAKYISRFNRSIAYVKGEYNLVAGSS
ncbi:hypothetical protein PUNSTDRAFT_59179, partial [Punctularia strigosozonata HHB-11173 SS5]|uniref:uncharacterized protein n=1 Tax=Punctularia strigosozonata (strain HHB-11173) TaxID=741275 RepID=UPI000441662D